MVITWIELEEFSTIEDLGTYLWFVCVVQLLCVCRYRKMLGDRGARVGHCLRELLVLVLHLVLGLVQAWVCIFWGNRFLSLILPDPSTLIRYCRSGRAVMIYLFVFHLRLIGLCIATVSPPCNGGRLCVYLLYLSTIFVLRWRMIFSWRCAATTHSPGNIVIVQGTLGDCVPIYNPLCSFNCELSPAIG